MDPLKPIKAAVHAVADMPEHLQQYIDHEIAEAKADLLRLVADVIHDGLDAKANEIEQGHP